MEVKEYIACSDCDLIHLKPAVPEGALVRCTRCGSVLFRHPADTLNRALALSLTGLILFAVSNSHPFLALRIQGQLQQTILMTGIIELYKQGLVWLAVLVFLTIVLLPLLELLGIAYMLLPLRFGRTPWKLARVCAMVQMIHHWGMMDVFMLGILVSMVKLAKMAEVVMGPAFYSFMALIFVVAAAVRSFNPETVWSMIPMEERGQDMAEGDVRMQSVGCHRCRLLCRIPLYNLQGGGVCPRCGASLHRRIPDSISRTWALLLAAGILYIPANLLPITVVRSLAGTQADTIMSGVVYFLKTGMIPIALVIFIASILVPLLKLIMLTYLILSVRFRIAGRLEERTRLYRLTEAVGRWSMVDVYVVTILVALVKLGAIASIEAGPGAVFFAGVVVITMFAAMSFDPRLIWDTEDVEDSAEKAH